MTRARTPLRSPEASTYRRNAGKITTEHVLHRSEKDTAIAQLPWRHRQRSRAALEDEWSHHERAAATEAAELLVIPQRSAEGLRDALQELADLHVPELLGKVESELNRLGVVLGHFTTARRALDEHDFGVAGSEFEAGDRELWLVGGPLVIAVNRALGQAAVGKEFRSRLEENLAERRQAKLRFEQIKADHGKQLADTAVAEAAARVRQLEADGYRLAAEILRVQVRRDPAKAERANVGRDNEIRVIPPQHCETFADVGGLESVKAQLRETIGAILERPDEAARYQVVHNGLLFYGPPGTGKNLLSRALAGEYGLRYIRFSPATIASAYLHEAAANLRTLFELAKDNTPCVLYLDEIDTIASDRGDQPSADHREVVTQLMVCLEEYRNVAGLVIAAGTNDLDRLDPALREGRFDAKILVPLPNPADRAEVLRVHLDRRSESVDLRKVDFAALAKLTNGYSAAALETVVALAAQSALKQSVKIDGAILAQVVRERGGQHRLTLDNRITWDDVVLSQQTFDRVNDVLTVFSRPDLATQVGIRPPAGMLLFGPPGTGKTTIARAMASQIEASFYEMSAADLLSKWAGESEQRVAKLFTQARSNRPSIIFIDEIDALLRRRNSDSASKWEERVLSQFLRELDGLKGGDGVLLVGATNRIDTIDEAIVGRRLEPIEVGLPDPGDRLKLLQLLCRDVRLAKGVNLRTLTAATEGMSGADLKRLRDAAGMRALSRVARPTAGGRAASVKTVTVTMADFQTALEVQQQQTSLVEV